MHSQFFLASLALVAGLSNVAIAQEANEQGGNQGGNQGVQQGANNGAAGNNNAGNDNALCLLQENVQPNSGLNGFQDNSNTDGRVESET